VYIFSNTVNHTSFQGPKASDATVASASRRVSHVVVSDCSKLKSTAVGVRITFVKIEHVKKLNRDARACAVFSVIVEHIDAFVRSCHAFKNSIAVEIRLLRLKSFTNGCFHFLIIVEWAAI
jgi:hypothetical protein